jgi:hypothetical protein
MRLWINGQWEDARSNQTIETIDPATADQACPLGYRGRNQIRRMVSLLTLVPSQGDRCRYARIGP